MTVYLGDSGGIELKRTSGSRVNITVEYGDVTSAKKRFSPQEDIYGDLLSGDCVDMGTHDGSNMVLVDGHDFNDWRGYIHVDSFGGIRLYDRFEDAIAGNISSALPLVESTQTQHLWIQTRDDEFSPLAKITNYEFTSERSTVDTTILGEEFVSKYEAGLISGQGSIDCIWEFQAHCDDNIPNRAEFPAYLAKLCIRLVQGADFFGRYFVYKSCEPNLNSVWYEAECIVTNATITVDVNDIIRSSINFVTTGKFTLLTGIPPAYLLMEDGVSYVLKEDGGKLVLAE